MRNKWEQRHSNDSSLFDDLQRKRTKLIDRWLATISFKGNYENEQSTMNNSLSFSDLDKYQVSFPQKNEQFSPICGTNISSWLVFNCLLLSIVLTLCSISRNTCLRSLHSPLSVLFVPHKCVHIPWISFVCLGFLPIPKYVLVNIHFH